MDLSLQKDLFFSYYSIWAQSCVSLVYLLYSKNRFYRFFAFFVHLYQSKCNQYFVFFFKCVIYRLETRWPNSQKCAPARAHHPKVTSRACVHLYSLTLAASKPQNTSTQNIPQHPKNISATKKHLSNHTQSDGWDWRIFPWWGCRAVHLSNPGLAPWPDVHCSWSCQPLRPTAWTQGQDLHLRDGSGDKAFRWRVKWSSFQVMGELLGIPNYSKLEAVLLLLGAVGAFLCWSSEVVNPIYLLIQNAINGASLRWPIDF